MRITTLNYKHPDYTEQHEVFVGTHTGSFKKLFISEEKPYRQVNLQNIANLNKDSRVTALAYGDGQNNEIMIGRTNKFVQIFSADSNQFCSNIELSDGPIVGLARYDGKIIGGLATGKIQMLQDPESLILKTGDNMTRMRQCHLDRKLIATGGKERQNNLKVYNMETGEQIFKSKNLPNDYLQLEVPIWDSDIGFIDSNIITTCSRYGYVRIYDIRTQRRPIHKYASNEGEQISFCSLIARENYIYVGTTMGLAKAFDMRKFKNFVHTYKGFTGSVSDLYLDETGKYLASASLDRYARIHHTDTCTMLYQCYVKSKATRILMRHVSDENINKSEDDSCILISEDTNVEDHKEILETNQNESDEEYESIFDQMPTICENDDDADSNEDDEKPSMKAVKRKRSTNVKKLKKKKI